MVLPDRVLQFLFQLPLLVQHAALDDGAVLARVLQEDQNVLYLAAIGRAAWIVPGRALRRVVVGHMAGDADGPVVFAPGRQDVEVAAADHQDASTMTWWAWHSFGA